MKTQMRQLKTLACVLVVAGGVVACCGAPPPMGMPGFAPPPQWPSTATTNLVNFVVRVEWKNKNEPSQSLQVLTTEGNFHLNTSQPGVLKINGSELPASISLEGDLRVFDAERGRLQLFLGRNVPYETSSGSTSTIQQRQEGLNCAFVVTFGKPVIIQKDANGEVSVLVEREKP